MVFLNKCMWNLNHYKTCFHQYYYLFLQAETAALLDAPYVNEVELDPQFHEESDVCMNYFDSWSEQGQVEFVQQLLQRMCHYQHGQINTFLKPMLQRDFISALPGTVHM